MLKDGEMGLILSYTFRSDNDPNIKVNINIKTMIVPSFNVE